MGDFVAGRFPASRAISRRGERLPRSPPMGLVLELFLGPNGTRFAVKIFNSPSDGAQSSRGITVLFMVAVLLFVYYPTKR